MKDEQVEVEENPKKKDLFETYEQENKFEKLDLDEYKKRYKKLLNVEKLANKGLYKPNDFPDLFPIHTEEAMDDCLSRLDIFQSHPVYNWLKSLNTAKLDQQIKQGYLDKDKDIN